ncbi:MAG TPA: Holliday junction resolvase RuvX [Patescibacteria group bacterium]|nr:Holliday junction resolvase RuvX [Patescibacteria group bacterium]
MEKLESILGIDLGEKRVGLAMAKSGIAFEYKTINFNNLSELIEQIVKICQDEKIEKIILGVAKNREGEIGFQANLQLDFKNQLEKAVKLSVLIISELYTTKEARRILTEMGLGEDKIKARLDAKAAQLILESYLEKNNATN